MRLVIISSDPDGRVGLVSERVFADAADATRELARMFGEGAADPSASFYTVDMDSAVPVIVLQPAAGPAVESTEEPAEQQPAEDAPDLLELAEPEGEEPLAEEPAAEVEELAPEGIVPASAVELEEAPAPEPQEAPVAEVDETRPDEPEEASVAEVAVDDEPAAEAAAEQAEPAQQWPWDLPVVVPEGAVDEDAPEPEPSAEETVEATAAGTDDLPMEAGLEGVTAFEPLSASVIEIAGEGPDVTVEAEEAVAVDFAPDDVLGLGELTDLTAAVEATAVLEDDVPDEVAEPQSVLEMTEVAEEVPAPAEEAPVQDRVYEPGALNMNEYTCDDCVYVNTCPNQHQKKPAECGSFQWRSM